MFTDYFKGFISKCYTSIFGGNYFVSSELCFRILQPLTSFNVLVYSLRDHDDLFVSFQDLDEGLKLILK